MHIEDKYEDKSDKRRMMNQKIKVTLNHSERIHQLRSGMTFIRIICEEPWGQY